MINALVTTAPKSSCSNHYAITRDISTPHFTL
jgi:hypothetical protein